MTAKERVLDTMSFKAADKVPLRYYYSPVGYYEHGERLNELYAAYPGDFEPFVRMPIPSPAPDDFDENGRFHAFKRDDWGVLWEYRIFGITGMPAEHPIGSPEQAEGYIPPSAPPLSGESFDKFAEGILKMHDSSFPAGVSCGNLYEKMISLYGDENVLCDIAMGERGINALADRIAEYDKALVDRAVKAGADIIYFGDDYGSERSLIMSPDCWRSFFKPRLKRIFESARDAGLKIHFHSCGNVFDILPDLRDIGVSSLWPQIPAYDMEVLAKRCCELSLAVEVHTDRANTMTYGRPEDVRALVLREYKTFNMEKGGAWFYVEADNGFPFENIVALLETIAKFR